MSARADEERIPIVIIKADPVPDASFSDLFSNPHQKNMVPAVMVAMTIKIK
jgi:hypothetical protein